ncbi:LLM class flavin-dependent oxidoreductase [Subtercola frigoramans]|uniref:FMN-dependent oxidoreductase (Nitrilotriacetate monooxygenase family) n=1 Tax=Subtercola frigoramans TaxID=120298 RepID=A0ABS2L7K8_9MICO|nr:LLM class flavin-dependent oxidoreductase [Subtercola frigoramans]MBM7473082.1 FMN-dependent oxidoreductase (nitrilotriacetate monooxygenase family) [Subtercola frigoramans]
MPSERPRMIFNAFNMFAASHHDQGMWAWPGSRQLEYNSIDYWVDVAQLLERGHFDTLFFADVLAPYDTFGSSRDSAVFSGMQFPINDPGELIPALAYATKDLGFVLTQNILQEPPYSFARKMSSLDHLTRGRISWNIVTTFLPGAGRNLGFGGLPDHGDRYARADDFIEVVYKLWEASWEDDAVVRNAALRQYSDPSKIHEINHVGPFYDVVGPHLSEPSPQRTPFLMQAGVSPRGRDYAGRNAEGLFINALSPEEAAPVVRDVRAAAARHGRSPHNVKLFGILGFVVGSTEEEAQRLHQEITDFQSIEANLAKQSVFLDYDFSTLDPAEPIFEIAKRPEGATGIVAELIRMSPNPRYTIGELVRWYGNQRVVGTPEQIVDHLEKWQDAGIDGMNVQYVVSPGTFEDFVEHVSPELRRRGLMQESYAPGTLREKVFPGTGPYLPDEHPARALRRAAFGTD